MNKVSVSDIQAYEIEHISALRAVAPECMVLLKRDGSFPLGTACEIALYGSGARETIKGGRGSGDVNIRHFVTVEEGLENAGFTITTKAWLDLYAKARVKEKERFKVRILAIEDKVKQLVATGGCPDEPHWDFPLDGAGRVCIYVIARNSGEGVDRSGTPGDFFLIGDEIRDILYCASHYDKFMLVLNVGGPIDLSPVLDSVGNILLLSQLGSVTGDAFADVLLGKSYPSGKLATTWAKLHDYPGTSDFGNLDETQYSEGIFVGYRWFDRFGKKPLFPFGFGLGFTDFRTSVREFRAEKGAVHVCAEITNIGHYAGKEVAMLFCSVPDGKLIKPVRELCAYDKTRELRPKESDTVTLSISLMDLASWDEENDRWLLEKGEYVFRLNSKTVGAICISADVASEQLIHLDGAQDSILPKAATVSALPASFPSVAVSAEDIDTSSHYGRRRHPARALPDLSGWSDAELAAACTGKHANAGGTASYIGNAGSRIAGTAGESACVLCEKGFGAMVMSDGPAGLRLARRYYEKAGCEESLDFEWMELLISLMSEEKRKDFLAGIDAKEAEAKKSGVLYRYASAIPIGTALAQAWNHNVPEFCGNIVGEEMERFGVNVWLAPALNIHRNPLCGRNFEYYSEDPLISGRTAAAVTRGVQKHAGLAVTIKHFAANNQETNRFGSDSAVSARALREIYLKGFEICVKEAAPKLLMTSYNLLNGIHTANRRELLTDILREEWGFDGVVMTDWGTTSAAYNIGVHGASDPAGCIAAGNDLLMPGTCADEASILKGLSDGMLARKDLELSAERIAALTMELA